MRATFCATTVTVGVPRRAALCPKPRGPHLAATFAQCLPPHTQRTERHSKRRTREPDTKLSLHSIEWIDHPSEYNTKYACLSPGERGLSHRPADLLHHAPDQLPALHDLRRYAAAHPAKSPL